MLLIDLQMPEACDVCPFNYDFCWCKAFGEHDNWEKYSDDWNDNVCEGTTRPEYCPLKEIVQCKDCRMGEEDTDFYGKPCIRCHNSANGVAHVSHDPEWYCADGKVKR